MSWSISLGRIAGTDIRIHLTFFLLLAWFAVIGGVEGGILNAANSVLFVCAVFASVIGHEFGHAFAARLFGIKTRDITLLPIGGIANVERIPDIPRQELLVALAGPAVSAAIAVTLFAVSRVPIRDALNPAVVLGQNPGFVFQLAMANAMLVLFNLLPAFPMDGGRVLRALLSMHMDRARATSLIDRLGQAIAFGLAFLGLFGNPWLVFIALFVFLAASQEATQAAMDDATRHALTRSATITDFRSLSRNDTIADAVKLLIKTSQREFPITDSYGSLQGLLTRDAIIEALSKTGPNTSVVEMMNRQVRTVNRLAPLTDAVSALKESGQPAIGVVEDSGKLIGLLEYVMIAKLKTPSQRL
jgi:Zn-dependent protease/CBS domain-containing protein